MALSPDGTKLAVANFSTGLLRLWDLTTDQVISTWDVLDPVISVAFSPDGTFLAGGRDYTMVEGGTVVWNLATGQQLPPLGNTGQDVYALVFSPNGATLMTGSGNGTIEFLDIATGQATEILGAHPALITSLALVQDGSVLASGGAGLDPVVKLWDTGTQQELATFFGHTDWVNSVAFSPDGRILASGSNDSTIILWDVSPWVAPPMSYVLDDLPKVDANGFIMSWMMLEPTIDSGLPSWEAVARDFIAEAGLSGKADLNPIAGDAVYLPVDGKTHRWVPVNLQDLFEMGEIIAPVGGNELDLASWGNRDYESQYLVTYLKWYQSQTVTFRFGTDDASESYFNGVPLHTFAQDSDWFDGNAGTVSVDVQGGQWNTLVLGVHETGGEWGFSVNVDVAPDEVDNVGAHLLPGGPATHQFVYNLPAGLTLFGMALAPVHMTNGIDGVDAGPGMPLMASDLIRLGATIVVGLEGSGFKTAVGRYGDLAFGFDFPIEPGKGYVINLIEPATWTLDGVPHGEPVGQTNGVPPTAPSLDAGLWTFAVAGQIPDADLLPPRTTLRIVNTRTGKTLDAPTLGDGRFAVAFTDANRRAVVSNGDTLRFDLVTPSGYTLASFTRSIDRGDLRNAFTATRLLTRPLAARLLPNYPNPFNPETWIPFELNEAADVTVRIYRLDGSLVRMLDLGRREAGYHLSRNDAAYWDGRNDLGEPVASGTYVVEFEAGSARMLRRIVLLK